MIWQVRGQVSLNIKIHWLIDWTVFYAVSAIFQPCNGGKSHRRCMSLMCHRNSILMYIDIFFATLEVERIFKYHFECRTETYLPILWRFWKRTAFAVILSISICYINSMQTYIIVFLTFRLRQFFNKSLRFSLPR